ncbi:MAG: division/cell wall cluster transcriptional repressor MraZ [Solibacillus sp.]
MGEYQHAIDSKGCVSIPAKLRQALGDSFVIMRDMNQCLLGYPMNEWRKLGLKLKDLPMTKKDARVFARFFFSGATEVALDKQGRIHIPSTLIQHANLEKECVVLGVSSKIEIWAKDAWDEYFEQSAQSFNDIAENMIDFDF